MKGISIRQFSLRLVIGNVLAILIGLFSNSSVYAQSDSLFFTSAINHTVKIYNNKSDTQDKLFSGLEYSFYKMPYLKGHPFFLKDTKDKGEVVYDGNIFPNVPLLYDISADELIVTNLSGITIQLIKAKIKTFSIGAHTFKYINTAKTDPDFPLSGFYEILHKNSIMFFVKRAKKIEEKTTDIGLEGKYVEINKHYIFKDKRYYQVNDKKAVLDCLKDRMNELKQFLQTNKLKFRDDFEGDVIRLLKEYENMKNNH